MSDDTDKPIDPRDFNALVRAIKQRQALQINGCALSLIAHLKHFAQKDSAHGHRYFASILSTSTTEDTSCEFHGGNDVSREVAISANSAVVAEYISHRGDFERMTACMIARLLKLGIEASIVPAPEESFTSMSEADRAKARASLLFAVKMKTIEVVIAAEGSSACH